MMKESLRSKYFCPVGYVNKKYNVSTFVRLPNEAGIEPVKRLSFSMLCKK